MGHINIINEKAEKKANNANNKTEWQHSDSDIFKL
jgi:hypothetical protein